MLLGLGKSDLAERTYSVGEYYRRTGKVASAEFYYGKIVTRWPKSEWAAKSKTHLASLASDGRFAEVPGPHVVMFTAPEQISELVKEHAGR